MKIKKILLILIIFCIMMYNNILYADIIKQGEKNENILKRTGFNIEEMVSSNAIKKIYLSLPPWNGNGVSSTTFPNQEIKNKIQKTTSVHAKISFENNLESLITFANFKTNDYAKLGLADQYSSTFKPDLKTLFSGEMIKDADIQIRILPKANTKNIVVAFLYNHCACILSFWKNDKSEISNIDLITIDNIIKTIKNIFDK